MNKSVREPVEVFPVLPPDEVKSVLADLLRRKDSEAREMAIKERLLKQLQIVRDGLNAMPPFRSRDLNAMRNALVQARDLCFQGLPSDRSGDYQDTYDGLMLAVDQLIAGAADSQEIAFLCDELLQYLSAQTQKETAFKKEIFFLPYKASMWDSLESVWKAADEDKEHCISYVMPIPYADLTPEHTVAEWHYERGMFPEDVPTVNCEDFDLQEMHPDVIFIHNPYDEYNRVTSVESKFYSSKLKNCTDKLVYIPYFVLAEPELDGKSEEEIEKIEEGVEGFILTPAVLNAHQVVVQSEAMRQVYIDVLTRKTDKTDRAFWEKRILGTGSPKFDKVVSAEKEVLDIPDEWRKIIEKSDGSRKKIVFYNTGLSALLHNDEKMLAKMRQVFRTFKEHQDEIALLWRPHPLIPATIKSMRPQLEKAYEEIVQQYKKGGWGIYDDSADVDRAVILSDAYYGDGSSVVQLYQKTSKPIMIQNVEETIGDLNIDIKINDIVSYDNKFFFLVNGCDVYEWTPSEQYIEYLGDIGLHDYGTNIYVYKDKLIIVPRHGMDITIYDIAKKQWRTVAIEKTAVGINQFFSFTQYRQFIYLIPGCYPFIIRFDAELEIIDQRIPVNGIYHTGLFPYLCGGVARKGNFLYMPFQPNGRLAILDIALKKIKEVLLDEEIACYADLEVIGENLYLLSSEGNIYRLTEKCTTEFCEKRKSYSEAGYRSLLHLRNKLFAFSALSNKVKIYDLDRGLTYFNDIGVGGFAGIKRLSSALIGLIQANVITIYRLDELTDEHPLHELILDGFLIEFRKKVMMFEKNEDYICDYISCILNSEIHSNQKNSFAVPTQLWGNKIYNHTIENNR